MATPPRLVPLLEQFGWACARLHDRMTGPDGDSGNGLRTEISPMTDGEYRWEPVPGCWSVRRRENGPGPRAAELIGAGEWGLDSAWPPPWPPPLTTIAWRLGHISSMLALRADHMAGSHSLTDDDYRFSGLAAEGIAAFDSAVMAWGDVLTAVTDDAALDEVGRSTFPYGSDPEDRFIETVWWVNQEVLHHGAEIALLRDLFREQHSKY
jgi:DinB superfamily